MSQVQLRHPLSVIFLLHIALDIPVVIQGLWTPTGLPFLDLNNTSLVFIKLYAALAGGICAAALLCFGLPEFLPGKRALAVGLSLYHVTCSTVLFNSPRFIPHSFGPVAESVKATPEHVWGVLHGLIGFGFAMWWQATVQATAMMRNQMMKTQ